MSQFHTLTVYNIDEDVDDDNGACPANACAVGTAKRKSNCV